MRKRWDETMQKRSGGFRTHSRFDPLIGVCVGCRDTGARGAFQRCMLRCAMRADATSFLRPTASGKDTSRRLRAPQTPRPRSPFHPARRVRTRPTARHPGRNSLRTTPRCCHCPHRPVMSREHPAARGSTTAADAGVGGQNLFSSQAGSGTRPAGEASSSGTAPQGRSEADIGKDAARRQQKREGGRSSAERMFDVRFERWLRLAFELRGFTRRACSSPRGRDRREAGLRLRSRAEFSSDSEAAGPCELGHGCKPRGVVHACSFPVFAFFGAE